MSIRALSLATGLVLIASTVAGQAAEIIISVPGIPGPYCAYGVEKRLLEIDGIKNVSIRWQKEQIRAELEPGSQVSELEIRQAVERADYPYDYSVEIRK